MTRDEAETALYNGLRTIVRDVAAKTNDPKMIQFLREVAATTARIAALPDGPAKATLMKEHTGTLRVIAERHRLNVAEAVMERVELGVSVGVAVLMGATEPVQ